VANPNKAKPILDILIKNREKLVTFLTGFHNDRQGMCKCVRARTCRPALAHLPASPIPRRRAVQ
jgi:hypothetical protein